MVLYDETPSIYIQHVLPLGTFFMGWGYVSARNFGRDYRADQA